MTRRTVKDFTSDAVDSIIRLPGASTTSLSEGLGQTGTSFSTSGHIPSMTTTTTTDKLLLWLDLESTGLDTSDGDEIIEIGCILTTEDLRVIDEYEAVVKPSNSAMARLVANQFLVDMHSANGLLDEIDGALPISLIEIELLAWLDYTTFGCGYAAIKLDLASEFKEFAGDLSVPVCLPKLTLAGSGVGHFDLPTVRVHMPALAKLLNYYVLDIGTIRRAHEMWIDTPVSAANDAKTHRAIDDIRCHLEEAQAFQNLWRDTQLECD